MTNPTGSALAAAGWATRQQEQKAMAESEISIEFDPDTLKGDVRTWVLGHIRAMETPWSKLNESQQQEKIDAADKMAETLVRDAVRAIVKRGFEHIVVSTGKWTVKDGVKLEVSAGASVDNIEKLAVHGTGSAVLVLADASVFFGEREKPKADPDQPDMIGEGDEDREAA